MKLRPLLQPAYLLPAVAGLWFILTLFAGFQAIHTSRPSSANAGPIPTKYNNYLIFKHSYLHLQHGQELYKAWPEEHWDLYKYSPTFALFFGCFAWLPDAVGLAFWNLLNAGLLFLALWLFPLKDERQRWLLLLLPVADLMTSLQNSQSNALIAGLLILAFIMFEKKQLLAATLFIALTFYIKLFGIVAMILLLFYPGRIRSILYAAGWMILLALLPAVVTGFDQLFRYYAEYLRLLKDDQSVSFGFSVMGWLYHWFGLALSKSLLALAGLSLLLSTLFRPKIFEEFTARVWFLAALLIWMVIFNHKAESPTFIIATAGVFIWFFTAPPSKANLILLILTLIFTSLASTDLFPPFVRKNIFEPYVVKAVPCILVWLTIVAGLLSRRTVSV